MKEKLKAFNISVDDITPIEWNYDLLHKIARKYAEDYDLKRYELVLNDNLIKVKNKFTGFNSYMGMKINLEKFEKEISFIVRPTNEPTYEELKEQNNQLKERINKATEKLNYYKDKQYGIWELETILKILRGGK